MDGIVNWIKAEGTGHVYFAALPICLLALFILMRGRRLRFVAPALLVSLVLVNPWFYRLWDRLGLYAYWRVLWIVPVVTVLAAVIPCITERTDRGWVRGLVVAAGIGLVALGGTFLYTGPGGSFILPAPNSAKLPEEVVAVADRLLALGERPRVIAQHPVGTYMRQYTGEIDTMFGRNIDGFMFVTDSEDRAVNRRLNDQAGDLDPIGTIMADDGYDYLVLRDEGREAALSDLGFIQVDRAADYGIYRISRASNLVKERNALGQVIRVTTVDEAGNPVDGGTGYCTTSYAYDDYGNVIREFRTDADGNGVANVYGEAGYEREYDARSHIIMERRLDADGAPIVNPAGYAEIRRVYRDDNLVRESYFDADDQPVNRTDTGYAAVEMTYDGEHRRTSEAYFDVSGTPVMASAGYATKKYRFDDANGIWEMFFDADGTPVTLAAGYAGLYRRFDENGWVVQETYLDESGNPTAGLNGYASFEQGYDGFGNMLFRRFADADGAPVVAPCGYAEVRRTYDGEKLVREEYYGVDGMPLVQAAGHVAIEQTWDRGALASRRYLGPDGMPVERTDGYASVAWKDGTGGARAVTFLDADGGTVDPTGLNLVDGVRVRSDGWSEWMTPVPGVFNSTFYVGEANLGDKAAGDSYTCQVEVEFRGVSAMPGQPFLFQTQGTVDGQWSVGNLWYPNVVKLDAAPCDGVCRYTATVRLSQAQAEADLFSLGFRCDYWASGSFRFRRLQIERGETAGEWRPGL